MKINNQSMELIQVIKGIRNCLIQLINIEKEKIREYIPLMYSNCTLMF